jgi:hypothetical protein
MQPYDEDARPAPSQNNEQRHEAPFSSQSGIIEPPRHITLDEVKNLLKNRDWRQRAMAARALARFGKAAPLAALRGALRDNQREVRVAALESCADLAPYVPIAPVLTALLDAEWSVRAAAVWALGRFEERAPRSRLLSILHDPDEDPLVRASALHALATLDLQAARPHLIAALRDSEADVREVAVLCLSKLLTEETCIALAERWSQEEDALVKVAIVHTLGEANIPLPQIYRTLQAALHDEDTQIRAAAEKAASTFALHMLAYLQHARDPGEMQQPALELLHALRAYIPDKAIIDTLGSSTEHSEPGLIAILNVEDTPPLAADSALAGMEGKGSSFFPERPARPEVRQVGDIKFIALTPAHLAEQPPIVAQALDNQWVPRQLLRLIMEHKLAYTDVAAYIEREARAEYIRSLINGRNVVINRAYFHNNPVIFKDFLPGSRGRQAFKALLNAGVIIPFLHGQEHSPDQPPSSGYSTQQLVAWQQVCGEVRMACVRVSWNDEDSRELTQTIMRRFHERVFSAIDNDQDTYKKDFNLDEPTASELLERLDALSQQARQIRRGEGRFITREDIYKRFITRDDTPPSQRIYDSTKPFSAEIKQYVDLAYNANLADALNGFLLTPKDTLPRSVLQEWEHVARDRSAQQFNVQQIIQLLRQRLFDLVQADLYLKSMRLLSLEDVLAVRSTDEWQAYVTALDTLLKGNLLDFAEQAPIIYRQYALLMRRITTLLRQRYRAISVTNFTAAWEPVPSLEIDIGGAKAEIVWNREGPRIAFSGLERPLVPEDRALFVVRLKVGDPNDRLTRADLFTNFDFMKGKLDAALAQWEELRAMLREIMSVRESSLRDQMLEPTLNEQEKAI